MEVAASAFATASIAKELGVGVKKLIEFWTSIEEAPNDVREIVDELNLLCDVFKDIESEAKQDTENATVKKILENCKLIIKQLESITHNLERGFASSKRLTRKWTAIKGALKCKQLDKFQTTLGRLKHTLTLALQTRTSRTLHLQFQHQQQILVALTGCVSRPTVGNPSTLNRLITYDEHSGRGLPNVESGYKTGKIAKSDIASSVTIGSHLQPDEPGVDLQNLRATSEPKTITMYPKNALSSKLWSTRLLSAENFQRKSIYGCLRVQSAQRVLELAEEEDWVDIGNRFESRTSIVVRPAAWMSRIGINYGFQVDISRCVTQGWKYTLSSVCTVPDNALIFQACEKGDIPIVRGLLARGEASARDTNSYGLTPLHVRKPS
ncbi:uncharacterized protein KY384_008800 [Bacidia gigantensis]|uniref:uncharacterized protein n=1 Tax=Bacidia gigantensis TaxID=2732470 RepID=UPI001D04B43C|nr:uncharacterized protein KY384_008800 [Bacidia gigantensis]KAG8526599.1 hypothetical protein KY384_008800 [Bacidia gigantensis]